MFMTLTMLGTGHALTTECYNTCFVLEEQGKYFMVDGGGGSGIFRQFKRAGLNWFEMHEIFVTHRHMDHLMGILWMVRMICQSMAHGKYRGEVRIYAHEEVTSLIRDFIPRLLTENEARFLNDTLHLVSVSDGQTREINGCPTTFFDIQSTKAKQFGFCLSLPSGGKLTCCGDEPYHPCEEPYAKNSKWLLHEAFCLHAQADVFRPYEKSHSTVKDACERAEALGVENLILYHTEDTNLPERKRRYTEEGKQYFSGSLYIPDDLQTIPL